MGPSFERVISLAIVLVCLSASLESIQCSKGEEASRRPAKFEYVTDQSTLRLEPAVVDAVSTQEAELDPIEAAPTATIDEQPSTECTCAGKKQLTADADVAKETSAAELGKKQKAEKKAAKKAKKYKVITITLPAPEATVDGEATVESDEGDVVEPASAVETEKVAEIVEKPRRKNRVESEVEAINEEEVVDLEADAEQAERETPAKKQKDSKSNKNKENKKQKFKRDTKEARKGGKSKRSSKTKDVKEKKQKDKNRKK